MARVVSDPGHPPDHLGDPVQGPKLVAEAVGPGPLEQCHLDGPDLLRAQPRSPAGAAGTRQAGLSFLLPAAAPHAGGLDADLELSGDFGRSGTFGEEGGRLATAFAESVEISSGSKPDRGQGRLRGS